MSSQDGRESKRMLGVFCGPPCVGKSTLGKILADRVSDEGITTHYIDEFKFIWEWIITQDATDHTLLKWGEPNPDNGRTPLSITNRGYFQAFNFATEKVVNELEESGAQLGIAEGARAIGGYPYALYFGGLIRSLPKKTKLASIEISLPPDPNVLLVRAEKRLIDQPNAAPVEVVREYLASAPLHPSAFKDAMKFPDMIVINEVVNNNHGKEDAVVAMEGVIGQVISYFR